MNKCLPQAVEAFFDRERVDSCERHGNGHIDDTFLVEVREETGEIRRYLLQGINCTVFQKPLELIENICGVTDFLKKKILQNGGDPQRETLNIIPARDGKPYYVDPSGGWWVVYRFIERARCLEQVERPEDFYESAVAFGKFQKLLADYPAETLHEIIPDFHHTPKRYETLLAAFRADRCGRASSVLQEMEQIRSREAELGIAMELLREGALPLRVTHNDTKLNNVMFDEETGKAICVIDLDTVMPGLSIFDFGDSIRFGANTAQEDEADVSKVSLSLELFERYTRGYLDGCGDQLTALEKKMLPMGAKIMTLESAIRFLTDYLQGDVYFKIERENHNLQRCRTQLALTADMERKWEEMERIVANASV